MGISKHSTILCGSDVSTRKLYISVTPLTRRNFECPFRDSLHYNRSLCRHATEQTTAVKLTIFGIDSKNCSITHLLSKSSSMALTSVTCSPCASLSSKSSSSSSSGGRPWANRSLRLAKRSLSFSSYL